MIQLINKQLSLHYWNHLKLKQISMLSHTPITPGETNNDSEMQKYKFLRVGRGVEEEGRWEHLPCFA